MQDKPSAVWVEKIIRDFISQSPENTLKNQRHDRAWADPLVGFSRGDDPLYEKYKEHVGPFHFTPLEIFSKAFPQTKAAAKDLTVISWILPQTESTKSDNRRETRLPAESWARSRAFGEEVNNKLRQKVVATLQTAGHEAVAPLISGFFEWKTSEKYGLASTWSERHVAHASGLGTFGLCDGLITPRGKAMRCGSVVAHVQIPPSPRPYQDHQAYCLFYTQGICGRCIPRCPAGAISRAGHDKMKCQAYTRVTKEYVKSRFGFDGYGCGLCQTAVPCESKIPVREDLAESRKPPQDP